MIGHVITREMKKRNITTKQLARATRYGYVTIWRLTTNRVKRPSLESLERIAKALGMTPEQLMKEIRKDGRAA